MTGAGKLTQLLEESLGGTVRDLRRLSGGASRQTWSFDLSVAPTARVRPLVAQVQRPGGGGTGIAVAAEAALIRAAAAVGAPVPRVVMTSAEAASGIPAMKGSGGPEPDWMVVERVPGETIPRKLLRDEQYAQVRPRLAGECGRALAAVHAIPVDAVPGLDDTDQLDEFRDLLGTLTSSGPGGDGARPVLELAARRLAATRPPFDGVGRVVHGDFRTGNLMIDESGLQAVLDWELAHVGDPREDLGWFCVRAWRFGSPHRAGGFGPVGDLLAGYEAASGVAVDREALRWWEAVGTFKWAIICMFQAATHRSGVSRSVELATIGRRVCENEWDLLGLLGAERPDTSPLESLGRQASPDELFEAALGSEGPEGDPRRRNGLPFGYPAAGDLVEAVREFLDEDVVEATDGRVSFHARVATNALRIVERELVFGPYLVDAHAERLAKLGFADDDALVEAIRGGEFDENWQELAAALARSTRDQLLLANPRHLLPDR
jgi:aminoglycoside phosphotransferase (APT) family kinase protein